MHSRSKGGGGKTKGGGGGSDTITKMKEMETKAIQDTIVTLRKAIYDDNGKDRDLTEKMGHFKAFKKNGLDLEIGFSTKLSPQEAKYCFSQVKENMEDLYDNSGYGWDDDDKRRELTEDGARFLLIREWPEEEGQEVGNLVGFAHFRVTVTGDFMDEMTGESCLCLWDIHIEEEFQRKGLGRHIIMMLEVMARSYHIDYVVAPLMLDDEDSEAWLQSLKGYSVATDLMSGIGLDSEMEGFCIYSKAIQSAAPRVSAPLADISNKAPVAPAAAAGTEKPKEATPSTETVFTADGAAEASMDDAVSKLKALYIEKNSKDPTDEMVAQWQTVLAEEAEAEADKAPATA